jgi:hypothetical protein
MGMSILNASEEICARYLNMMLEGAAHIWLQNLPPNSINSWDEMKEAFIKNFQGTCKRLCSIEDLERCVQKEGESSRHWMRRVAEIIHSSDNIPPSSAVLVMEKNCKFEPLVHKLGRMKDKVKSLSEVMAAANKYASSDKTRDASDGEEEENTGKGKKASSKPQQQQASNANASYNKRKNEEGNSGLVANTNTRYKQSSGRGRNFHPVNLEEVFNRPCDIHIGKDGKPPNHTKAQCYHYKKWKDGQPLNTNFNHQSDEGGKHGGGNNSNSAVPNPQSDQPQFPKQLGQYHTIVVNTSRREQKLRRRNQAVNAIVPAVPQWLKWSEQPVVWSREDHPGEINEEGKLALVVAPQVAGYKLSKVLMDGGSSINILYYETFKRMNLQEKQLHPSRTTFHGVVPGISAQPLGRINLEVAFGTQSNFRSEYIWFEVVDFQSPYHALFGREAFAKFMARPCYVYLKLKIPGPRGVITINGDKRIAQECEEGDKAIARAACIAESAPMRESQENFDDIVKAKRHLPDLRLQITAAREARKSKATSHCQ